MHLYRHTYRHEPKVIHIVPWIITADTCGHSTTSILQLGLVFGLSINTIYYDRLAYRSLLRHIVSRRCSTFVYAQRVNMLIGYGADINESHGEAIRSAALCGNNGIVEYLISVGADVNVPENAAPLRITPAIEWAYMNKDAELISILLAAGAIHRIATIKNNESESESESESEIIDCFGANKYAVDEY